MHVRRALRVFFGCLVILSFIAGSSFTPVNASSDCDKAQSLFWKGQFRSKKEESLRFYMKAIKLCPGFIRPYELIGNLYRKEGQSEKAIEFFTKAADLGSTNHKLYYLLASLLFEKGDLDQACRYLKKSLSIRDGYPKAMALKARIERETDKMGPKIVLYEPATPRGITLVQRYENITVRGVATDKSGIAWVKVNQSDAAVDQDGNFLKDTSIKLGTNIINIVASDGLGNRSTLSVTVEREKATTQLARRKGIAHNMSDFYEKTYAVVIGIDSYERWPQLEFAVADARAVSQKLEQAGFDKITTLFDKEATQKRVLTVLGHDLPKKIGRNDLLVFYFAGHGQTEDLPIGGKIGYIIPVDADTSNYFATAISMEQIRNLSRRLPAKHILYVMDSCYSGLGLSRSSGISPNISGYLRKIASMRVVQIITAGGKGEQAQEKEGHGLFTTYFLRALEGEADINNDGVVTGTELGAFLRPQVSNASQQAQTPLFGRLEGEGEVLFFVGKR